MNSSTNSVAVSRETTEQKMLRVMFVEDNDYVRDLTLCLLESPDREVLAVTSAEEALEEFKRKPFDLVITDVSLPKMSGMELAKRLLVVAPDTWIVIASGYALPKDVEKMGAHVRAISKPFENDKIDAVFAAIKAAAN